MRLTFLGTGTSSGVPAIACACRVCSSHDLRDQRLRTSSLLEFTDARGQPRAILIDASPDLRQQALRAKMTRCDAVLFTHNHVDHTFGLDELRRFNVVMHAPIDVYAERHTIEHLHRVYKHIFDRQSNINDSFVATLNPHPIEPERPFELFGVTITPIRLLHGRLPILGFRFDAPPALSPAGHDSPLPLAYCTDVSGIPPETWKHLTNLNTLVLDALRHRKHPTHLTLQDAVNIADRVAARQTYFVHMSHDLAHEETNASLPESVQLAHDGLTLGRYQPPPATFPDPAAEFP
ncbi:MAG: MBL fold metallo-hydrolase [Phycisphaeraceae bacterium]|nr:MBL fold metallo-hydrolase [Phycisphaeraceae bacterium]